MNYRLINTILHLGRQIFDEYTSYKNDQKDNHIQHILDLIELEERLFLELDTNSDLTSTLKIKELNLKSLPYGIETLNRHDYSYYRLLSHFDLHSSKSLNDLEIGLLFNSLIDASKGYPNILTNAYQILFNSRTIERQILENDLQPSIIYDTVNFENYFKALQESIFGQKDSIEPPHLDSQEIKIAYFTEKLLDLIEYIKNSNVLSNNNQPLRKIIDAYMTALISILNEEDLEDMRFNVLCITSGADIQDFIIDSFGQTSKLLSFKRTVSFLQPKE